MPAIGLLLNAIPFKYIAIVVGGLAIAFVGLFVVGQIKKVGVLEAQNQTLQSTNSTNAQLYLEEQQENIRKDQIIADLSKTKTTNRKHSDSIRAEIRNAPETDNGTIAPVLRRQLDRLPINEGASLQDPSASKGGSSSNHVTTVPPPK